MYTAIIPVTVCRRALAGYFLIRTRLSVVVIRSCGNAVDTPNVRSVLKFTIG